MRPVWGLRLQEPRAGFADYDQARRFCGLPDQEPRTGVAEHEQARPACGLADQQEGLDPPPLLHCLSAAVSATASIQANATH